MIVPFLVAVLAVVIGSLWVKCRIYCVAVMSCCAVYMISLLVTMPVNAAVITDPSYVREDGLVNNTLVISGGLTSTGAACAATVSSNGLVTGVTQGGEPVCAAEEPTSSANTVCSYTNGMKPGMCMSNVVNSNITTGTNNAVADVEDKEKQEEGIAGGLFSGITILQLISVFKNNSKTKEVFTQ